MKNNYSRTAFFLLDSKAARIPLCLKILVDGSQEFRI